MLVGMARVEHRGETLADATDLARVGALVPTEARRLTAAHGATFVLRDGEFCFYADEDAISPMWKGRRFPIADCITGWAMLHRSATVVPDIEVDPRIPLEASHPTFVRSLVVVPIGTTDPVGAIGACWDHVHTARSEDVRVLETLAARAARAMARIDLTAASRASTLEASGDAS